MEILEALLKYGTSPGVVILYLIWQEQRQKRNGGPSAHTIEHAVEEALASQRQVMTQHLDLAVTEHFDQLRRDLETKIGKEHEASRKDWTNALQRLMLDLELFVLRGDAPERRRRE